jgi:4-amino-4-deoxy-L-arabinose transferase-like glycosyltransferase
MTEFPASGPVPNPAPNPARRAWPWGLAVMLIAAVVLGHDLRGEPPFVDEWAYISQAYFLDLLAEPNHPAWVEYPAFDLPPLPKYLVALGLIHGGQRIPGSWAAEAWYRNSSATFGDRDTLVAARRPIVIFGVLGIGAAFALGTIAGGRGAGVIAASLLLLDPLYRMLARRAMSDVPCEALTLLSLALGLAAWKRTLKANRKDSEAMSSGQSWRRSIHIFALFAGSGMAAGLAVLCKFNGMLAIFGLAAWAGLAVILPGSRWPGRVQVVAGTLLAFALAFGTFVALNPFLTSRPILGRMFQPIAEITREGLVARCVRLVRHRIEVPRGQQVLFPHNALIDPGSKAATMAVQGFGRFGPLGSKRFDPERGWWFDSTRRYDWIQDRGAIVWLPAVMAGFALTVLAGRDSMRRWEPPAAWAVAVYAAVALAVVTTFLPLAWDRFFLPVQAPSILVVAVGASWLISRARRRTS